MEKRMLYIIPCGVPCDAPGIRVYNIACLCRDIGVSVDFLSNCFYSDGVRNDEFYDGFLYSYINSSRKLTIRSRIGNTLELLYSLKTITAVKEKCNENAYDYIMVYGGSNTLIKALLEFCSEKGILLLSDVTEWYEQRKDLPPLSRIRNFQTNERITKWDKKTNGIIAISQFLYDYYKENGANVIKIPPVFSKDEFCSQVKRTWKIPRLVYAGSPAKKDFMDNVYLAVQRINESGVKIEFNVIGVAQSDVNSIITTPEENGIHFYGRLPHAETIEILRNSDFCILIRECKRYAKAGYSTKFAEAMSNGVAMICNSVGGCDLDVISGNNGFLIEDGSITSIEKCLQGISQMSSNEIVRMKEAALSFAKQKYLRDAYYDAIKTLFR